MFDEVVEKETVFVTPPPARPITWGPMYHWFGYYDKLQFDPTGRYVLGMAVGFEHRSPHPDDVIQIGMVDLADGNRWIALGETRAWCWQQGCMLQWRPGSDSHVLWNDRAGDRFVCRILDTQTLERKRLDLPIYTINPDGRTALSNDFRRVNDTRPGYGYAGLPDPNADVLAPKDAGIHRVDLETGDCELLVTIADVASIPYPHRDLGEAKHYFNHLLFSPDGTRFVFLHRWCFPGEHFQTRLMTAAVDGGDVHVLDDFGQASHFIWRDPGHVLAWAYRFSHNWAFYLYEDGTDQVEVVGQDVMTENGHCSYLPGNEWILNDTYPDEQGYQHLYLYRVASGKKIPLGSFCAAPEYKGEWRCDLHPRFSPDGCSIVIDSVHEGNGRQMYLIDASRTTKEGEGAE
jgi:hypothetical protein